MLKQKVPERVSNPLSMYPARAPRECRDRRRRGRVGGFGPPIGGQCKALPRELLYILWGAWGGLSTSLYTHLLTQNAPKTFVHILWAVGPRRSAPQEFPLGWGGPLLYNFIVTLEAKGAPPRMSKRPAKARVI